MPESPDTGPDPYNLRAAEDRRPSLAQLREARLALELNYILLLEQNRETGTQRTIAKEWLTLDHAHIPQKKVRVTLLLDEHVAKFFRARGRGYQAYINDVLKFYVHLRGAKIIEGIGDRGPGGEAV